MTHEEVIFQAFRSLAKSRSPAYTKEQQDVELGRCWELLAGVVYGTPETKPVKQYLKGTPPILGKWITD